GATVLEVGVLVDEVGGDGQIFRGLEQRRHPGAFAVVVVEVLDAEIGIVHITVIPVGRAGNAQRELVVHYGHVHQRLEIIHLATPAGGGDGAFKLRFQVRQVGFVGDKADVAAHGPGAIKGALRTAQHLDPLDVKQVQVGVEVGHGDRQIVIINA